MELEIVLSESEKDKYHMSPSPPKKTPGGLFQVGSQQEGERGGVRVCELNLSTLYVCMKIE
jgi:hypothetical protein